MYCELDLGDMTLGQVHDTPLDKANAKDRRTHRQSDRWTWLFQYTTVTLLEDITCNYFREHK